MLTLLTRHYAKLIEFLKINFGKILLRKTNMMYENLRVHVGLQGFNLCILLVTADPHGAQCVKWYNEFRPVTKFLNCCLADVKYTAQDN